MLFTLCRKATPDPSPTSNWTSSASGTPRMPSSPPLVEVKIYQGVGSRRKCTVPAMIQQTLIPKQSLNKPGPQDLSKSKLRPQGLSGLRNDRPSYYILGRPHGAAGQPAHNPNKSRALSCTHTNLLKARCPVHGNCCRAAVSRSRPRMCAEVPLSWGATDGDSWAPSTALSAGAPHLSVCRERGNSCSTSANQGHSTLPDMPERAG